MDEMDVFQRHTRMRKLQRTLLSRGSSMRVPVQSREMLCRIAQGAACRGAMSFSVVSFVGLKPIAHTLFSLAAFSSTSTRRPIATVRTSMQYGLDETIVPIIYTVAPLFSNAVAIMSPMPIVWFVSISIVNTRLNSASRTGTAASDYSNYAFNPE